MKTSVNVKRTTRSVCPECFKVLDAELYEINGTIRMKKNCPEHGECDDLYWSDEKSYDRFLDYLVTDKGFTEPITKEEHNCPKDCGICPSHHSGTCLLIVDVTNRCNMKCPICFANANVSGFIYEPTSDQIKELLVNAKKRNPAPLTSVQFSGGEPTLREDLPELIAYAKSIGYSSVYINTNGIRLSKSVEYCKQLVDAGLERIYLQFDGVTPEPYLVTRGADVFDVKVKAIENMRSAGFKSVNTADKSFFLVVTVVKGVNDHQLGDIIRFAAENKDVVKTVNFQQVSFMGRINQEERDSGRITTPDCFRLIKEQTNDEITDADFFPYSHISRFLHFYNSWRDKYPRFKNPSCHPHCGSHALVYVDKGKLVPYNKFLDIGAITKFFDNQAQLVDKGSSGLKITYNFLTKVPGFIKTENLPSDLSLMTLASCIKEIIMNNDKKSINLLNENTITISNMHFMDAYNMDLERTSRCIIHYAVPDGRLIPFCTYNNFYRSEVEKNYGAPIGARGCQQTGCGV